MLGHLKKGMQYKFWLVSILAGILFITGCYRSPLPKNTKESEEAFLNPSAMEQQSVESVVRLPGRYGSLSPKGDQIALYLNRRPALINQSDFNRIMSSSSLFPGDTKGLKNPRWDSTGDRVLFYGEPSNGGDPMTVVFDVQQSRETTLTRWWDPVMSEFGESVAGIRQSGRSLDILYFSDGSTQTWSVDTLGLTEGAYLSACDWVDEDMLLITSHIVDSDNNISTQLFSLDILNGKTQPLLKFSDRCVDIQVAPNHSLAYLVFSKGVSKPIYRTEIINLKTNQHLINQNRFRALGWHPDNQSIIGDWSNSDSNKNLVVRWWFQQKKWAQIVSPTGNPLPVTLGVSIHPEGWILDNQILNFGKQP